MEIFFFFVINAASDLMCMNTIHCHTHVCHCHEKKEKVNFFQMKKSHNFSLLATNYNYIDLFLCYFLNWVQKVKKNKWSKIMTLLRIYGFSVIFVFFFSVFLAFWTKTVRAIFVHLLILFCVPHLSFRKIKIKLYHWTRNKTVINHCFPFVYVCDRILFWISEKKNRRVCLI